MFLWGYRLSRAIIVSRITDYLLQAYRPRVVLSSRTAPVRTATAAAVLLFNHSTVMTEPPAVMATVLSGKKSLNIALAIVHLYYEVLLLIV